MSLGLPIRYPLKAFPYELINKYEIGWNYPPKNSSTLARIIMDIIESPNKIKLRSQNSMTLFNILFLEINFSSIALSILIKS